MKHAIKLVGIAAVAATMGSASYAATIDFTKNGSYTINATDFTGSQGGGWTLIGFDKPPHIAEAGNADCPAASGGALACENDGVGVGFGDKDDEIPAPENKLAKYVTITFTKLVKIVGFTTLDTYVSPKDAANYEIAYMGEGEGTGGTILGSASATQVNQQGKTAGFAASAPFEAKGYVFSFFTKSDVNDDVGSADFALASIELAPIPLPAGLFLMGTALGGLGIAARRRKA